MTTALTIRRATTTLPLSSGLMVLFLVALGWFYSFMQLITLDLVEAFQRLDLACKCLPPFSITY